MITLKLPKTTKYKNINKNLLAFWNEHQELTYQEALESCPEIKDMIQEYLGTHIVVSLASIKEGIKDDQGD